MVEVLHNGGNDGVKNQMAPNQVASVFSEPIRIGKLTLKNRIVMGPMAANAPDRDGRPSEQTIAFFEARARGGAGMIIVGGFGRMGLPGPGRPIISASPSNVVLRSSPMMPLPGGKITTPMAQAATIEEIEQFERDIVAAAVRMHRAGFDGVELAAIIPRAARPGLRHRPAHHRRRLHARWAGSGRLRCRGEGGREGGHRRLLKAPLERTAIGAMGSQRLMNLAGRFMKSDD